MKNKRNSFFLCILALFCLIPGMTFAQNHQVEGTVIDESNQQGLVGVTVMVRETNMVAITDANGHYSLQNVPQGSTITFSYVGYTPQEFTVTAARRIDVILQADAQMMDEVVVIAYGQQTKATLTGAISSVGGKELLKSPVANMGNALAGKLPGVQTVQYSGMPGEDSPTIRVRGTGTLNDGNAAPLVLVDGVERDFMQIDPNEVADISILKDASATAVFGVRGANGVILVTTKRGQAGQASVSLSAQGGVQTITRFFEMANSYEYAMAYNGAQASDGTAKSQLRFSDEAIQHFKDRDMLMLFPDTDWYNYLMKDAAWQSQYNVNVSGGNDTARYFVSAGAFSQDGFFKTFNADPEATFKFKRYNYRANIDLNLSKHSQLSLTFGGRVEVRNDVGTGDGEGEGYVFRYLQEATPMSGYGFDDQGRRIRSHRDVVGYFENDGLTRTYDMGYRKRNKNVLNLDLQYKLNMGFLTEGLSFNVKGSYNSDYTQEKDRRRGHGDGAFYYEAIIADREADGTPIMGLRRFGERRPLPYTERRSGGRNWRAEASFNYARKFGDHNVTALALYNQEKVYYPGNDIYTSIPRGLVGLVGRVTYDYATRYLVDLNVGYNGSENFAPGKRYGLFPSASVGWVASNEDFWEPIKGVINYLKIRASYGIVGNDRIGGNRFLYLPTAYEIRSNSSVDWGRQRGGEGTANFGINNGTWLPSAREVPRAGNPNVTWETANKQNYGIDLAMLNDRLSLSVDVFFEDRRNILEGNSATIPFVTALPSTSVNYGRVKNHGYEVTLRWEDRIGDFYYSIAPTLTFARNEVVKRMEVPPRFDFLSGMGHPVGQPFGREFFEFYMPNETERRYEEKYGKPMPYQGTPVMPGDMIYVDLTGDGIIDGEDQHAIGYTDIPEYNASINFNFSYKGFDFSMLWIGATNVSRALSSFYYRPPFGTSNNYSLNKWVYDNMWTPETADTATYPRLTFANNSHNFGPLSSVYLTDGSYIRLKNAEIGYTFRNIPKVPQIGSIRVYVSGYNLLTFSKFTGNDPESQSNSYTSVRYPMTRVINFGVNVNF